MQGIARGVSQVRCSANLPCSADCYSHSPLMMALTDVVRSQERACRSSAAQRTTGESSAAFSCLAGCMRLLALNAAPPHLLPATTGPVVSRPAVAPCSRRPSRNVVAHSQQSYESTSSMDWDRLSVEEIDSWTDNGPPTPLLDTVNYPVHLKNFTVPQLRQLCKELRSDVVHTVSKTGGHLSSSLGVVELTVALHYVFNCPEDKLIWDVGHQCYIHKILTGRRSKMATIRQTNGLSGRYLQLLRVGCWGVAQLQAAAGANSNAFASSSVETQT